MVGYFDSSVLLAILLDEESRTEAHGLWKDAEIRVSSILLKIETVIVLRRTFEHYKTKLGSDWLTKKTIELEEYLKEVNYRLVDEEIEQSIFLKKDLAKCRTLDAIHLATALEFSKIVKTDGFLFHSYDSAMLELARQYKIRTNIIKNRG